MGWILSSEGKNFLKFKRTLLYVPQVNPLTTSMKLLKVERTRGLAKEYVATFQKPDGRKYMRRFGTSSNYATPGSGKTKEDRDNYRARHKANPQSKGAEKKPDSPFNLSMHILWGESRSVSENVKAYKKRFGV